MTQYFIIKRVDDVENVNNHKYVQIDQNMQIIDTELLKNLMLITRVRVNYNSVSNLNGLQNIYYLDRLELIHNSIFDITPLSSLQLLRYLNLQENRICDISPLVKNKNLVYLNVAHNQLKQIPNLSNSIQYLNISFNEICQIQLLPTQLLYFSIQNNLLHDTIQLNFMFKNKKLRYINLVNNPLFSKLSLDQKMFVKARQEQETQTTIIQKLSKQIVVTVIKQQPRLMLKNENKQVHNTVVVKNNDNTQHLTPQSQKQHISFPDSSMGTRSTFVDNIIQESSTNLMDMMQSVETSKKQQMLLLNNQNKSSLDYLPKQNLNSTVYKAFSQIQKNCCQSQQKIAYQQQFLKKNFQNQNPPVNLLNVYNNYLDKSNTLFQLFQNKIQIGQTSNSFINSYISINNYICELKRKYSRLITLKQQQIIKLKQLSLRNWKLQQASPNNTSLKIEKQVQKMLKSECGFSKQGDRSFSPVKDDKEQIQNNKRQQEILKAKNKFCQLNQKFLKQHSLQRQFEQQLKNKIVKIEEQQELQLQVMEKMGTQPHKNQTQKVSQKQKTGIDEIVQQIMKKNEENNIGKKSKVLTVYELQKQVTKEEERRKQEAMIKQQQELTIMGSKNVNMKLNDQISSQKTSNDNINSSGNKSSKAKNLRNSSKNFRLQK